MSRKTKILIVAGGILLLLLLAYWLFIRPSYEAPGGNVNSAANVNGLPSSNPVALPAVNTSGSLPETAVPDGEKVNSDVSRLAAAFAERFGSYSNQGSFENILDLRSLMTEKMKVWADDFVEKNSAASGSNAIYSGVTTKAISVEMPDVSGASSATVTVKTQRRETSGSMVGNEKIVYQDLELSMVKVGDEWKIDDAAWK